MESLPARGTVKRALNFTPSEKADVKKTCHEEYIGDVESDDDSNIETMDQEWTTAGSSKTKRHSSQNDSSQNHTQLASINSQKLELANRTVYVAGKEPHPENLAKSAAYKKAIDFKREVQLLVGPVDEMKIVGDSIRVTCQTKEQAEQLLSVTQLIGFEVVVTPPRSLKAKTGRDSKWFKGVIKQVPTVITNDDIIDDTGAIWAHRITRLIDGSTQTTKAVIIAFQDSLPDTVQVGFMNFRVHPYIPTPIRCTKCQKFGHKATKCRQQQPTCPRCSQHHEVKYCTLNAQSDRKCTNCGKTHSAAYKGCDKYKTVTKILAVSTKNNWSYREAAKAVSIQQREASSTAHVRDGTSFATVAATEKTTASSATLAEKVDCGTQTEMQDGETQTDCPTPDDRQIHQQQQEMFTQLAQSLIEAIQCLAVAIPATDRNAKQRHGAVTKLEQLAATIEALGKHTKPPNVNNQPPKLRDQTPTATGKQQNKAVTAENNKTAVLRATQGLTTQPTIKSGSASPIPASGHNTKQ